MKLLTGGTLIDGTGNPPAPGSAVLVNDDGRIEAVGHQDNIASPQGTETISIAGMTLLPGLIDCHDHLSSHGYDLMGRWGLNEPNSLQNIRTVRVMEQTLLTGYTTVRDAGWLDAGFKLAVEEGLIPGPRLVVATSPISPTGGLADRCSPSGHHQPPSPDPNLPIGVANGVDQVRAMVREVVRIGADVVKFATTGGASSRQGHGPKDIEFGRDEIEALVNEAHALGKKVMCHALGGPGLRMAVEAGADSIEHGTYLDEDPDLIKMMADKGTFFVPTFTVYIFHGERGTPHGQARSRALYPHHIESVQRALAAGVKVVAGTDAGGWGHVHNARELQCLVEAGMTPMQALVAATGWAAECLSLEKEIGTVERGKSADLLVVDGDPLRDITLLQSAERLKLVMKEGKVYSNRLSGERVTAG
jgi:imidazolonepropionase-like amidohydrolase